MPCAVGTLSCACACVCVWSCLGQADVNARCKLGKTPAHVLGHAASARALIEARADVTAADCWGKTALHYAAGLGDVDWARALVEGGGRALLMAKAKTGKRPLEMASGKAMKALLQEAEARAASGGPDSLRPGLAALEAGLSFAASLRSGFSAASNKELHAARMRLKDLLGHLRDLEAAARDCPEGQGPRAAEDGHRILVAVDDLGEELQEVMWGAQSSLQSIDDDMCHRLLLRLANRNDRLRGVIDAAKAALGQIRKLQDVL